MGNLKIVNSDGVVRVNVKIGKNEKVIINREKLL